MTDPNLRGKLTTILIQQTQVLHEKYPYAQSVKVPTEYSHRQYRIQKEDGALWLQRTIGYRWTWAGDTMEALLDTLDGWDEIEAEFKKSHEETCIRGKKILERFSSGQQ